MKDKHITDMTKGSPTFLILRFALPLLFGNVFQQFYSMVDSMIVGNYVGSNALAAVGTCGSTSFLFFSLSAGLATGISILVSQYFGANDETQVRNTIGNATYVLLSASLFVSILSYILAPAIFHLLKVPANILPDSITYMRTSCFGIIFIAAYNGVAGVLRALGDSKTPLYFLILSSFVNVGLDLFFVLVLHLGVFGVALATVISQVVSAVTCMIYAYHKVSYFRLSRDEWKLKPSIVIRSFTLGTPIALQNSMIAVSCMALQGVVNSFGTTVMAAYTVTGRVEQIVQQGYGSLSAALTTYAGQNQGAGRADRVRKGYWRSTWMALVFSLCLIPVFYLLGERIIGVFVKDAPEVIVMGAKALRITSLAYFALGMIYVPRAVLNGCGDTGFALLNGITEVICRIGFSLILIQIPWLSYWSIWVTTILTWVTTAAVCIIRYARGKWELKSICEN